MAANYGVFLKLFSVFSPTFLHARNYFTNERQLSLFERKVLRYIFGAKQENGTWRKRYHYELCEIFNEPNIVNYIS